MSQETDRAPYRRYRRRRLSTLRLTTRIAALASAATLGIGAGLAWQMSQGGDPALGSKAQTAASAQPRQKIVKTTVVRQVQSQGASSSGSASSSGTSSSSISSSSSPAPVTSSTS